MEPSRRRPPHRDAITAFQPAGSPEAGDLLPARNPARDPPPALPSGTSRHQPRRVSCKMHPPRKLFPVRKGPEAVRTPRGVGQRSVPGRKRFALGLQSGRSDIFLGAEAARAGRGAVNGD
ncbi:uncharacterized protein LOC144377101 [Ictidomys tridecemlineatus]